MPFIAAPNIVQVEMRCTRASQKIENRVMVNMLTAPVASEMLDIATVCWNWWQDVYGALLTTDVALREVVATDLSASDGAQITYAPSTTVTGGINLTGLPNEVSFCVSLRSAARGRSARGRFYTLSVAPSQMANANELTAGSVDNFVGAVQQLINDISDAGKQMTIVSYRHDRVVRPGGPVYYPVVAAVAVDAIVDSMKRRKPGVGE